MMKFKLRFYLQYRRFMENIDINTRVSNLMVTKQIENEVAGPLNRPENSLRSTLVGQSKAARGLNLRC